MTQISSAFLVIMLIAVLIIGFVLGGGIVFSTAAWP